MIRSTAAVGALLLCAAPLSHAVDLEAFEFNDANGTTLTGAANSVNPGNQWSYDVVESPGDGGLGDASEVSSGVYRLLTNSNDNDGSTALESRFLDIANVTSGEVYLTAEFSSWDLGAYDGTNAEQIRFTFLEDDTGTSGSTVTAQVQIRRNADSGALQLVGDAIGTAGSFDIENTVELADVQNSPFTIVLAVDKTSNSFEVFYKDGANPSQSLGMGGVSRVRDVNSLRMVTNNFGTGNLAPLIVDQEAQIERIVVSDDNPLTDLVTLEVDRDTGAMTLVNNSGAAVTGVDSVTLASPAGAVDLTDFLDFSGTLSNGQSASLDSSPGSSPGLWIQNPVEDVLAQLNLTGGGVRTLDVDFVGNGGVKYLEGDLNFNGVLDAGDYAILAANAESDLSALSAAAAYQLGDLTGDGFNDVADFSVFKTEFVAANGVAAFERLIAGVPEPSSTALFAGLASCLALRRRRGTATVCRRGFPNTTTMSLNMIRPTAYAAPLLLLLAGSPAHAVIFEEFLFDDTEGTAIEAALNNINPDSFFDADDDSTGVGTNGLGQLDLSPKNNDNFGTHFVDIEPAITSGTVYGVMEVTWDFQSVLDTTQNEELRISLTNNAPRGTEITAEFRIVRNDSDQMIITGRAGGTGASIPDAALVGSGLSQADTFIAVVAADLDNDTYEILYSADNGVSFLSGGTAAIDPGRVVEAFRLGINNDFVDDNVLIDRVYIADELPIVPEIETLKLQVNSVSGVISIVNDTANDFDIDYYRITSGDDSLLTDEWDSLQDQELDAVDGADGGSVAGDGDGEVWTEAGGSDAGVLSESFLLSSSQLTAGSLPLFLGQAFDTAGDASQLTFEFRDATTGGLFAGEIEIVDTLEGDFNGDMVVDAADYTVWRDGFGSDFEMVDYLTWRANFGASGLGSPVQAPEPTAVLLVGIVGLATVGAHRRCRTRSCRCER